MHRTTIISTIALVFASNIAAQGIDDDDIAPDCVALCTNIVNVSDRCEDQFDDTQNEDKQELNCICTSAGMDTAIPECEACQSQYYGQDDDYDDIRTLLSRCGFSSISATNTLTSMGSAPTGQVTVVTSTYTETDGDDDDDNDIETTTYTSFLQTTGAGSTTDTGGATTSDSSAGTAATGAAGSAPSSASGAAEQSGNLAPAITAAPALAIAGVAAAALGL